MTARVLIVDDKPANLRLLEAQLHSEFFDTVSATNGRQALSSALRDLPDIVLLDVMLPDLSGYEVCRRLKADRRTWHIPVLMLTALDSAEARAEGTAAGADDFLLKPAFAPELIARVRSHVRLKLLADEFRARESGEHPLVSPAMLEEDLSSERSVSIVVVDDHAHVLGGMSTHLGDFGAVIHVDRRQAFDQIARLPVDLVILPLIAEEEIAHNLRLAARIRSNQSTRRLPILAAVNRSENKPLVQAFELGVNDCVRAPVEGVELVTRVRTLLRRKRLSDRMRRSVGLSLQLASTDAVTGLFNRHYLEQQLDLLTARARAAGKPLSVLMLDIDHFKVVNDTHGHAAGDKVLRAIGELIIANVRGIDIAARYGGEEFAIVMPETDLATARPIADRLRRLLSALDIAHDEAGALSVTTSIGVAELCDADQDGHAVLARADNALYWAKRNGRNRVGVDVARTAA
jgi:two-component system cell cycle response regulator